MITLSELYFLNSGWDSHTIIRVSLDEGKRSDGCLYIKGRDLPNCRYHDYIVVGFSHDFVLVKEGEFQ